MAHETVTVNPTMPKRRWSRVFEIELSDTIADANLQRNKLPFLYIQNVGTGGLVMIAWEPDDALEDIYLAQGATLEGGHWKNAMITGTGAGVDLRGFVGTAHATPGL